MKPWVKYLALLIGVLAILAMATLVVGCDMKPTGGESDPVYAYCTNN